MGIMPKVDSIFILLFALSISGCGEDILSAGASIGGSGTGSPVPSVDNGGTLPISPLPSEDDDPTDYGNRYIIWSNDKKESNCDTAQLSIQLLHSETGVALEQNQGTFISQINNDAPTNVILEIKIYNFGLKPIYEYLLNYQPNIKLQNLEGITLETNQYFSSSEDIIITLDPLQTRTYHYNFAIPIEEGHWKVIYRPILSFGEIMENNERKLCDPLIYDLKVEKY